MANHIDIHTDIPLVPAINAHTDILHVDTHTDTPETSSHGDTPPHGDTHTDTSEIRHQDIHADIRFNETTSHIDSPSIPAVFIHEDTPIASDSHGDAHTDIQGVLHQDESNFHIDTSGLHTDISHSDRHGDGLQFSDNGMHLDVHHDAPPDHTDGSNHVDFITSMLNNRKDFHEDVPRITFHADSSLRADISLGTEPDEGDK